MYRTIKIIKCFQSDDNYLSYLNKKFVLYSLYHLEKNQTKIKIIDKKIKVNFYKGC